ncbi:aminotransferase class IV [Kitasatospora sp. LaBMicrA B282]|uniref:aminotransferase class IV n=1 Tax=Kitasatospora sp. LaBMicrA B282 TaxID=3420949 RepID=UPI003D104563
MEDLDGAQPGLDEVTALALTGYGHFTTMRVENGSVRGLTRHLARLERDCRTVFGAALDLDLVRRELRRAAAGSSGTVVVRVTVFDPDLSLAHPAGEARPQLLVTTRPAPPVPQGPFRVQPVRHLRQVPRVKHTGLFDGLYLRRAAQLAGYDDVLFTPDGREVAEGATWNVGFFDGRQVLWPQAEQLPGITMALLAEAPGHLTRPVLLDELPTMQAAFATNAAVGVRPIAAVGAVEFPAEHPVLDRLRAQYAAITPEPVG